jgi:transcriptional antiterminator
MLPDPYIVLKVFNNNVILARHRDAEKILIRKGLGFGKREGDCIDPGTDFEKIFTLENQETGARFNQLIAGIDAGLVGVCEEIIAMISRETGEPVAEEVHVRLIDHIAFAVYRLKNRDTIINPFIVEIETLYAAEMEIAKRAVAILAQTIDLAIPDDEAGFIALHIHTLKNRGKLSNTIKYAYLCNAVMELIEAELEMTVDRKSIDYSRFITHIRFAVERIAKRIPIKNDLLASIRKMYKRSYKVAQKVAKLLEEELGLAVTGEETGYIAMHIERLRNFSPSYRQ